MKVFELFGELDLRDEKYRQKLSDATSSVSRMGDRVSGVGRKMTMGVTLPLIGIATAGVKSAAAFEGTMNTMRAVAGVPQPQLAKLRDLAIDLGAKTAFSASEAADGMLALSKAGVSTSNIMGGALKNSLDLATAGELEVGHAAEITSNAMNVFGLSGRQSKEAVDALAGAANASSADVSDLAMALSMGGNAAATAGLSVQETAAALAQLADQGIRGSDAGTSLKTMLLSLSGNSVKARTAIKDLGLEFFNSRGEVKSLKDIAGELSTGLGDLTQKQQMVALKTIFGTDAFRAANIMMKQGEEGIQKYTEATSKQGAAADVAKAKMEGLPGALEKLRGALETVVLVIGDALAPAIEKAAGFLTGLADAFLSLPPSMQTTIVTVGAVVAAAGPLMWVLGKLTSGLGLFIGQAGGASARTGLLTKAFGALRAGGMGLGMATLGLTGIVAASGVAIYAWSKAIGEARKTSKLMHEAVMANVGIMDAYKEATDQNIHSGEDLARMVRIQIQNARDSGASQEDLNAIIDRGNELLAAYNEETRTLANRYKLVGREASDFREITGNVNDVTKQQRERVAELINKMDAFGLVMSDSAKDQARAALEAGNFKDAINILKRQVEIGTKGIKADLGSIPEKLRGEADHARNAGDAVGRAMGQGLKLGLQASIDGFAAAAAAAVNAAEAAARNAAGAQSPSKLFMHVGADLGDGLRLGIDSMRRDVARSTERLISVPALKLPIAASAGPMGGTSGTGAGAGTQQIYNVEQVVLPNITGAVAAEEFFDSLCQTVSQGV